MTDETQVSQPIDETDVTAVEDGDKTGMTGDSPKDEQKNESVLDILKQRQKEIEKQQKEIEKLKAQRIKEIEQEIVKTMAHLKNLENEYQELSGKKRSKTKAKAKPKAKADGSPDAPNATKPGRPKSDNGLREVIVNILKDKKDGMSIQDIMTAILATDYESNAKDFYAVVAQTIRKEPFRKVERGVYAL